MEYFHRSTEFSFRRWCDCPEWLEDASATDAYLIGHSSQTRTDKRDAPTATDASLHLHSHIGRVSILNIRSVCDTPWASIPLVLDSLHLATHSLR